MSASLRREPHSPLPGKTVKGTGKPERKKGGPCCPICGKPTAHDYRPFCGRRCADIDLGRWLDGRYAVPGEPVDVESNQQQD